MRRLGCLALAAVVLAGCGGSAPKGPPALVFVSVKNGDYAIFGADANGKHAHRLTKERGNPETPEGLFFQVAPAWSPDGTRIAFASAREGVSHLFVMRWDGTGTRRLTSSRQNDDHPAWSPDGKWILFARQGALFRVPAGGGEAQRVGSAPGLAGDPAYSPAGRLIAYDYKTPGQSTREIWVMGADGSHPRKLTSLDQIAVYPAWSPDGKRIAFQTNAFSGHFEIYSVGVGGGEPARLTSGGADAIEPAFSPAGELTFSRDGAITVLRDGKEEQLTSGKDNDSGPAWRPV